MSIKKFIRELLKLKNLIVLNWKITRDTIVLQVAPYKNGCRCPHCGRRCKVLRKMEDKRSWDDLPVMGRKVIFQYTPREIQCPTHGRIQEEIPWARSHSRVTYRHEYAMLVYCQSLPQKEASFLLKVSASTLSDRLHRLITSLRDGHKIRGLKTLGVDEISYHKGHKYATIVYDLERSCVVWVGKGKLKETLECFFREVLSPYQREQITWASCDMSEGYINAIEENCPNCTVVLDRFHIVKALNEAVDEVRKEQWRELQDKDQRRAMKGLRWLLFKHANNRSKKQTRLLNQLRSGNRRIHRAWVLKDEFNHFWEYCCTTRAEKYLLKWMTSALKSRLEPIRSFVRTLKKHKDRIISFTASGLTNAKSEGINRIIRMTKNKASGFRTLEAFSDLIYLIVGDLDLPAQIPKTFRVI